MREILFRGKHKGNGQWVFGDLLQIPSKGYCSIMEQAACAANVEVIPETVGQFTGLTDKNGKKIFEGDILEAFYDSAFPDNATRSVVVWNDGSAEGEPIGWYMKQGAFDPDTLCACDGKMNRVIGNIHDNPELLGGTDNA